MAPTPPTRGAPRGTPGAPRPQWAARAVRHLARGAWSPAHAIVQRHDSALAAWLHGIVHTLEGDLDNARYWYRKARRPFPGPDAVKREIAAARQALPSPAAGRRRRKAAR